jgi:Zn-dependent alcohol dehydrogenase
MAESIGIVYEVSPKINVLPGKLDTDKNCKQCLDCRREIETLCQELNSANEIIRLLKEDVELITTICECKYKPTGYKHGSAKTEIMTENQFAVFSNVNYVNNDHELQKQPKGTNKRQSVRNREKNKII